MYHTDQISARSPAASPIQIFSHVVWWGGGRRVEKMPASLRDGKQYLSLTPTIPVSTLYEAKIAYIWGPALPFELSS